MSASNIEWTDRVWNPVTGCTKVSQGCKFCYAETIANRKLPHGGFTDRPFTTVRTHEDRLTQPMKWRKSQRVFVNSMSDLFHESVPFEFIDKVCAVMALSPKHTFQILTKRPERLAEYFSDIALRQELVGIDAEHIGGIDRFMLNVGNAEDGKPRWPLPLPNVWLGVSVENQEQADKRIPLLLQTPAAVRFVSYEPALGPVDFKRLIGGGQTIHVSADVEGLIRNKEFGFLQEDGQKLPKREAEAWLRAALERGVKRLRCSDSCEGFSDATGCPGHRHPKLDWMIVGGESGPKARPFDLAWARSTVEQCKAAGVACFVKQLGTVPMTTDDLTFAEISMRNQRRMPKGFKAFGLDDRKGGDMAEWPEDLRVRQFPVVPA